MVIYIVKLLVLKLQRLMLVLSGRFKDNEALALVCLRALCYHGADLIPFTLCETSEICSLENNLLGSCFASSQGKNQVLTTNQGADAGTLSHLRRHALLLLFRIKAYCNVHSSSMTLQSYTRDNSGTSTVDCASGGRLIAAGVDDFQKPNPKANDNDNAQDLNSTEDDGFQGSTSTDIRVSSTKDHERGWKSKGATRARHPCFGLQPVVSSGLFPGPKLALLRGPEEEGGNRASLQHLLTQEANSVILNWLRIQSHDFTNEKHTAIELSTLLIQFYIDEDDLMIEMLLQCLEWNPSQLESTELEPGIHDLVSEFMPLHLFNALLAAITYDHMVLVDFLISESTGPLCLQYVLGCLRLMMSTSAEFGHDNGMGSTSILAPCLWP
jgi:hypothetical protein